MSLSRNFCVFGQFMSNHSIGFLFEEIESGNFGMTVAEILTFLQVSWFFHSFRWQSVSFLWCVYRHFLALLFRQIIRYTFVSLRKPFQFQQFTHALKNVIMESLNVSFFAKFYYNENYNIFVKNSWSQFRVRSALKIDIKLIINSFVFLFINNKFGVVEMKNVNLF